MNRAAQSFRKESVTADSAMRNTHMHKQVGVTRWARQDSNLTSENPASDIENKENAKTEEEGGAKCAPLITHTTKQVISFFIPISFWASPVPTNYCHTG